MKLPNGTLKPIRLALLAFGAFLAGIVFHKYKVFPYPLIVDLAKNVRKSLARSRISPSAVIDAQHSRDLVSTSTESKVETALLPLSVTSIRISEHVPFPKTAGGITVVGDTIIVADRLGAFYSYRNGRVSRLSLPSLTNNLEAFISSSSAGLSANTLRVHDIEYVAAPSSLAVSFERFEPRTKKVHLAVSLILVEPGALEAKGGWRDVFLGDGLDIEALPHYYGMGGGGRLQASASGKLLVSAGDYVQDGISLPTSKVALDPKSTFGKIFEVDLATGERTLLSRGHRNPQGLVVTTNGDIFSTEHAQAGGDELNLITSGANYGWPNVTLGVDYNTYNWPHTKKVGRHDGYTPPVFAWVPSIGVSNLIQIKGFNDRWSGDMLVASLKAMSLYRLRLENNHVIYSEPIWIGERVRDLVQLDNDTILLWTDDSKLLFLRVDAPTLAKGKRTSDDTAPASLATCMSCHHLGPTNPTHPAPTLSNLLDRKIASDNFDRYSAALKSRDGVWTTDTLRAFISDPNGFAQGSLMPKPEIRPQDLDAVVAALAELGRAR